MNSTVYNYFQEKFGFSEDFCSDQLINKYIILFFVCNISSHILQYVWSVHFVEVNLGH